MDSEVRSNAHARSPAGTSYRRWTVVNGPYENVTGTEVGRSVINRGDMADTILELDCGTRHLYVNLADCRIVVGECV